MNSPDQPNHSDKDSKDNEEIRHMMRSRNLPQIVSIINDLKQCNTVEEAEWLAHLIKRERR